MSYKESKIDNNSASAKSTVLATHHKNVMPDYLEIDLNDLEFYERCGNGSYGCVYRALWVSRNKEVAVKKILQLEEEANVLSKLSHRNIIKFYGAVAKPPNFCLVTEYASNGALQSFIHSHDLIQEFGLDLILEWAKDIALGCNYLHEEAPTKIIHRDLKSTNVVITSDMVCKICDFGTSIFNLKTTKMSLIGTFPWMAPEIIQGKLANQKCDIWSYGVVLWELLTGEFPFKGLETFQIAYLVVEREERLPIPSGCPHILSELMRHCWKTDPKDRPSFKQILATLDQIYFDVIAKDEMYEQLHTNKPNWEFEIKQTFDRLKKIEQDLYVKERQLDERERKLREEEIKLINSFKIITIEDYDVNAWREVDVYEWVKKTGERNDVNMYAELFLQHNINGETLLKLTKDDLKNIGISSVGHLVYLSNEIQRLKLENARLKNFPPLKHAPSVSKQISTKDVTFCACIGSHIIPGSKPEDFTWKMFFDIYDGDSNQDTNILLCIRDVKFVCRNPPFQQFYLTQPPFVMQKWVKGLTSSTKIDCVITYEEKVIKPRSTKIEYELNIENNKNLIQNITITLENSNTDQLSSTHSLSSLSSLAALISSSNSSTNTTISDAWKNRTFENSIELPSTLTKNASDLWSGIVTGKYKNDLNQTQNYSQQKSASPILIESKSCSDSIDTDITKNKMKYKRFNTISSDMNANPNVYSKRRNSHNINYKNTSVNNNPATYNPNNTITNSTYRRQINLNNNNNTNNRNRYSDNVTPKNTFKKRTKPQNVFFQIGDDEDSSASGSVKGSNEC